MRQRGGGAGESSGVHMDPNLYAKPGSSAQKPKGSIQALWDWPQTKVLFIGIAFSICAFLAWLSSGRIAQFPGEVYRFGGARYQMIRDTEVVWQKPADPKGVLFVAHGCSHGAVDFWSMSVACPKCTGLPEEMNITRVALERGYAVLAISSMDRTGTKCWNLPGMDGVLPGKSDVDKVLYVFEKLLRRERLYHLPMYGLGASSGGGFVLALASRWPFDGICSQIMGLPTEFMDQLVADETVLEYAPTMLVHMPRDEYTADLVAQTRISLQKAGVMVKEVAVEPTAMTPTSLSDAIRPSEVTVEQSKAIYTALSDAGLIDEHGFLTMDPRSSPWRQVLVEANVPGLEFMRLGPDLSPISEELNLMWAFHEITSKTTTDMLDWFESRKAATAHT